MVLELSGFEHGKSHLAGMHSAEKGLCAGMLHQSPRADTRSEAQRKDDCISSISQFDTSHDESRECLSPQHPTTKETEAANVLMNLSGKATDRISHGRVETGVHSKELSTFEGKAAVFSLTPANLSSTRIDFSVKREHLLCDEVPQINEKDLLPLATQVLCQFCSKQCEDLVELHEHVLAMHNVPDAELPLMPSVKKQKSSSEENSEQESAVKNHSCEIQKEDSSSSAKPVKCVTSSKLHYDMPLSPKKIVSKKLQFEEKITVSHETHPNVSFFGFSEVSQKNDPILYSEEKGESSAVSQEICKTTQVLVTPKDSIVFQGCENVCFPIEQQNANPVSAKRECEGKIQRKQRGKMESNGSKVDTSDDTPIVSDALAIAVEASQIKISEAKVTIFVCLKCSVCYTHSQEFKNHSCTADRPFISTCTDGSVVLFDSPSMDNDHLQLNNCNIWYFPEFLICQKVDHIKEEIQILEIVHCISGRKLLLSTSYQPSYLGEQFISFR